MPDTRPDMRQRALFVTSNAANGSGDANERREQPSMIHHIMIINDAVRQ